LGKLDLGGKPDVVRRPDRYGEFGIGAHQTSSSAETPRARVQIAYYQLTGTTGTALAQYYLAQDEYIFDAFHSNPAGQAPFALQHFEG
jgi:hypothetical protein